MVTEALGRELAVSALAGERMCPHCGLPLDACLRLGWLQEALCSTTFGVHLWWAAAWLAMYEEEGAVPTLRCAVRVRAR